MTHRAAMPDPDERLTELEIKLTLAEDHLERLDAIIVQQQRSIQVLTRQLERLARERRAREPEADPASDDRTRPGPIA